MRRATKLWIPPKPAIIRCAADVRRANFLPGWMPGAAGAGGGGAAEFPVVEATNFGDETDSTINVLLPAGIQSGELLLVFISIVFNNIDASTPSGWSSLFNSVGAGVRGVCFYRTATGSEGSSLSVSFSGTGRCGYNSYRISGASGTPEVQTSTGYSTTPNPPSLSPSWGAAKTLWIAATAMQQDGSLGADPTSYPSGYSGGIVGRSPHPFDATSVMASAYLHSESASEDPGTFSFTRSGNWIGATVAIQGA